LASCGQRFGIDLLRTEMRIAEVIGSERLAVANAFVVPN
jgi:hypothetical protein